MILAGDVGATKTILGLFRPVGTRLRPVRESVFRSSEHSSFAGLVEVFLAEGRQKIRACAMGVAGPVTDGRGQVVNLPWSVDARRLAKILGLKTARLLNDLEAMAWGIPAVSSRKKVSLTPGLRARPGNAALIAAGTGLGMAVLCWDGARHIACASEGGHQGFAPNGDIEIALLRSLQRRYGRVSLERVISGGAFRELYQFFIENGWGEVTPEMRTRLAEGNDPSEVISRAGVRGDDAMARKAVDMFVGLYGRAAGDLALAARATAGVYVAGGIAPAILPRLRNAGFVRAFRDKGRLEPFLARIPIRVILEPRVGLLGAARCALRGLKSRKPPSPRRRSKK